MTRYEAKAKSMEFELEQVPVGAQIPPAVAIS